jgi:hypothetical protein
MRSWLHYFWKIPFCGLLFFIGFIPGGMLATWLGFPTPELPLGADQATVAQSTLLGTLVIVSGLAALGRGISGSFLSRWLILFGFTWIIYGVNIYLEAVIFTTMSAASPFMIVLYLPAAMLCTAAAAWLFPTDAQPAGFLAQARLFFAHRSLQDWTWRLAAAFLAFPLIYLFFGRLIAPLVLPYYQQGLYQLTLPGWELILPMQALRSLLFLLACLPILITWRLSNLRLFFSLGLALFILVGGLAMAQAYWLVPVLRLTHGLEIFADEMVYAGALILLLRRPTIQSASRKIPVLAS